MKRPGCLAPPGYFIVAVTDGAPIRAQLAAVADGVVGNAVKLRITYVNCLGTRSEIAHFKSFAPFAISDRRRDLHARTRFFAALREI